MKTSRKILILALSALTLVSCKKKRFMDEPGFLVPKTVDQDPNLPSISVNGTQLHSEAFGHPDSTLIICLHGGPGSDYRSLYNLAELSNDGYRVVFYDQRGSGLSQRFSKKFYSSFGPNVADLMFDDLSALIAHYKTHPNQKVILIGNSWGGILATAYSGRYPNSVQGLVVCDPGGLKWEDIEQYIKTSLDFKVSEEILNNIAYLDQFITGKEDQHEILDYKLSLQAGDNPITGEINTAPGSFWRSGAVVMEAFVELGKKYKPDFSAGINQFEKPVLFLYSEKNKAYPISWAEKISSVYPSVELYRVMGVGHTGIITDMTTWKNTTGPKMRKYIQSIK